MNKIIIWGFGIVVFLVIAMLVFQVGTDEPAQRPLTGGGTLASNDFASDHTKGATAEQATISLVEYGDFQCPACASSYPNVKQLAEEFGDDLVVVYRHFPLTQIHRNALEAARAAESAGLQGSFWEMHDMLFERQREWSNEGNVTDLFVGYAESLGLDTERFLQDIESDLVQEKVNRDIQSGNAARVSGTPSFYLQGEKLITTPNSYPAFREVIQSALEQAVEIEDQEEVEEESVGEAENGESIVDEPNGDSPDQDTEEEIE